MANKIIKTEPSKKPSTEPKPTKKTIKTEPSKKTSTDPEPKKPLNS